MELLVVIVVLAILVTISGFAYSHWRVDTIKTAIFADLKNASAAMEHDKNFNNVYPSTIPKSFNNSSSNISVYVQNHGTEFCLEGINDNPPLKFHIRNGMDSVHEGGCD